MTNSDMETVAALMEKYGPSSFIQGCVTVFEERADEVYAGQPNIKGNGARNCYLNVADRLRDVAEFAPDSSYKA